MKMPKFHGPNFGGKGKADVDVPEGDAKASLPDVDVDIKTKSPDVNVDVEAKSPDVDVDLKGSGSLDGSLSGPEGKKPKGGFKFGIKMPKFHGPKFGGKVKGPKVDESLSGSDVEIKAPKVEASGPDVDVDLDLKGKGSISGSVDGSLNGSLSGPEGKKPKGGFKFGMKMPKFHGPKFGGKVKDPKVDGSLSGSDMEIKAAKVEASGPDVDVDLDIKAKGSISGSVDRSISGPDAKVKGKSSFKLPKFGFSGREPKVKTPDVDVEIKDPSIG